MGSIRRSLLLGCTLALLATPFVAVSGASAAVTASLSKSSGLINGEQITITLAGVPADQGVYIQQCYQPKVGLRAATGLKCNGSQQQTDSVIWATMNGVRGSQSAAGPLTFTVRQTITAGSEILSCGVGNCALFIYRATQGGAPDYSLDTIVPLRFLVEQTVKVRAIGLPKPGSAQEIGDRVVLRAANLATTQNNKLRVVSLTPRVCTAARGASATTVSFVRGGECSLRLVAKASGKFARFETTINYTVG